MKCASTMEVLPREAIIVQILEALEESKFASFGKPLLLHTQESQVP